VKVSERKVAEHRAALMETARRLLQERGFDSAGVAEISREAGLTQGALHGQFKSKNAVAREAACKAFADGAASWRKLREAVPDPLSAHLDAYLCESHM
jgi:TetR/AcrR family transcriptional repressor of nem operon